MEAPQPLCSWKEAELSRWDDSNISSRHLSTQSPAQGSPLCPSSVLLQPAEEAAVGCRAAICGYCSAELQQQRCCIHVFNSQTKSTWAGV